MSDGRWAECLDRFEAHLLDQFQALVDGRPDLILPFAHPAAMGPLPAHLELRAQELARDNHRLEQQVAAAAACSARHLQLLAVLDTRRTGRRAPAYVDGRS